MIPDPALGFGVEFPTELFKNAIHFAMQLGTSPDPNARPQFVFKSTGATYFLNGVQLTTTPRLDRDRNPLNPDVEVRNAVPRVVSVDCAVEIERANADELPIGNFRPTKATVTVLDSEYALVKGCRELLYNGDRYAFGYEPEANGLFDVGVNTLIFYALDES